MSNNISKKNVLLVLAVIAAVVVMCGVLLPQKTVSTVGALEESEILLTVNGEPLYVSELAEIEEKYPKMSKRDLIEGMVLEILILQDANKRDIQVSEKEVRERIEIFKLENRNLYDIAIKQYETEENYKQALKYRMQYEKTKEEILKEFTDFYWEEESIEEDARVYIEKNKYDSSSENIAGIKAAYKDNYTNFMKTMVFYKYNFDLAKQAVITYTGFVPEALFTSDFEGLDKIKEIYPLSEMDKDMIRDIYSCLIHFDAKSYKGLYTLEKVYGIEQSTNYFNDISIQFSERGTENKITVEFILDSGNQYGLVDRATSTSVLINGMSSYYSKKDRAYYVIDEDINGIFIISSDNMKEEALADFTEQVISYTKIEKSSNN